MFDLLFKSQSDVFQGSEGLQSLTQALYGFVSDCFMTTFNGSEKLDEVEKLPIRAKINFFQRNKKFQGLTDFPKTNVC